MSSQDMPYGYDFLLTLIPLSSLRAIAKNKPGAHEFFQSQTELWQQRVCFFQVFQCQLPGGYGT
jgi:hypothetical protein